MQRLENFVGVPSEKRGIARKWIEHCRDSAERGFYKYSIDVSSGWIYWTTTYATQELLSGMELDSIVETRKLGLLAHAIGMRPIGKLRNYVAKKFDVTEDSSFLTKLGVNLASVTPIQAVLYGAMLAGAMVKTGNYDWKESGIAWGVGVGLGSLHAFPYGWFQDRYRRFFGVEPAIKKNITGRKGNC